MDHVKVKSSNVESYAYDPATKTLEVRFLGNPKSYSYQGVPQHALDALLQHPSFGQGLNLIIKGHYDYKTV